MKSSSNYTWNINKIDSMVTNNQSRGSKFFKIRIDLNTTQAFNRPRVKKLACIFKEKNIGLIYIFSTSL